MTERRTWLVAAALVAMAVVAPSCADGDLDMQRPSGPSPMSNAADTKVQPAISINANALQELPICSELASGLRGKQATIYTVSDSGGLDALDLDTHIVCVDSPDEISELGIIVVNTDEPLDCDFCDGTPLPALTPPSQNPIN